MSLKSLFYFFYSLNSEQKSRTSKISLKLCIFKKSHVRSILFRCAFFEKGIYTVGPKNEILTSTFF